MVVEIKSKIALNITLNSTIKYNITYLPSFVKYEAHEKIFVAVKNINCQYIEMYQLWYMMLQIASTTQSFEPYVVKTTDIF